MTEGDDLHKEGKQTEQNASSHEAAPAVPDAFGQTTQDLENLHGNVAIGRDAEEKEGHLATEEEFADVTKSAHSGLEAQETSPQDREGHQQSSRSLEDSASTQGSAVAAASQKDSSEDLAFLSGDEFYNSLYDLLKTSAQEGASAVAPAAAAADDQQDLGKDGLGTSAVDLGATVGSPRASEDQKNESTAFLVPVRDSNEVGPQSDSVQEGESSSSSKQTAPNRDGNNLRRIVQDGGEEQHDAAPIEENIRDPNLVVDGQPMATAHDSSETAAQQEGAADAQPKEEVAKEEETPEHPKDDADEAAVQNNEETAALDANASPSPGDATQSSTSEGTAEENPNGEAEGRPMTRTNSEDPSSEPVEDDSSSSTTTTTPATPEKSPTALDAGASGAPPALTSLTTFAIAILGSTAVAVAAF